MKARLKDYIEMIFADAPECAKTNELKEEMYANVCDKYDDLIGEGKTPAAAYNISVASIGDISELIDSIKKEQNDFSTFEDIAEGEGKPTFTMAQLQEIEKYRKKSGIMTSVAIALYILCWVPLVVINSIPVFVNWWGEDACGTIGIAILMIMVAVATVLMVMKSYIRPVYYKEDDEEDKKEEKHKIKKRKNPIIKAISGCIWGVAFVSFMLLGTFGGLWHPGWLVFPIAAAFENISEAIFEISGKKYL